MCLQPLTLFDSSLIVNTVLIIFLLFFLFLLLSIIIIIVVIVIIVVTTVSAMQRQEFPRPTVRLQKLVAPHPNCPQHVPRIHRHLVSKGTDILLRFHLMQPMPYGSSFLRRVTHLSQRELQLAAGHINIQLVRNNLMGASK